MTAIIAFLATRLGQAAVGVLGLAALWFAFATHYESKGAAKVTQQYIKNGGINARKAEAARRSVDAIPDDRLRDLYFRD